MAGGAGARYRGRGHGGNQGGPQTPARPTSGRPPPSSSGDPPSNLGAQSNFGGPSNPAASRHAQAGYGSPMNNNQQGPPPKPGSGGFDGPGEHSRNPSQQVGSPPGPPQHGRNPSQQLSQQQSPQQGTPPQGGQGAPARQNPFGPSLGYDPAKPVPVGQKLLVDNRRLDLCPGAFQALARADPNVSSRFSCFYYSQYCVVGCD